MEWRAAYEPITTLKIKKYQVQKNADWPEILDIHLGGRNLFFKFRGVL
jgi:hypothetical protein